MLSTWELIAVFAVAIVAYIPLAWIITVITDAAKRLIAKVCYWL